MTNSTLDDSSSSEAVLASAITASTLAGIFLFVFALSRSRRKHVYTPREYHHSVPVLSLSPKYFRENDPDTDQLLKTAGLDAVMLIRFMYACIQLFAASAVFSFAVLLPCYGTGENGLTAGMNKFSLSNVVVGSNRLWASTASTYFTSAVAVYLFCREFYVYRRLLQRFRERFGERAMANQAVMILGVPKTCRSDIGIRTYLEQRYGEGSLLECKAIVSVKKALKTMMQKRDSAAKKLERVLWVNASNKERKRQTITVSARTGLPSRFAFCCTRDAEKRDAENVWKAAVARLNKRIASHLQLGDMVEPSCAGLAVFKTQSMAISAISAFHAPSANSFVMIQAPKSNDIVWENARLGYWERQTRRYAGLLMHAALVILWTIPVAFVAALTSLESLQSVSWLSWLSFIVDKSPFVKGILEGLLPSLALIIFMALLPTIVTQISRIQGCMSKTSIMRSDLRKLFEFQVINVFFVSLISGSFFNEAKALVDDPARIIELLAESVPTTGNFFISYVILSIAQWAGSLSLVGRLIVSEVKLRFLAKTPRDVEDVKKPMMYDYGRQFPRLLLMLLIGTVYSTVSPIMAPVALIFFVAGAIVLRFQMQTLFKPELESSGAYVPLVLYRAGVAIFVYQVTMIGVIALHEKPVASSVLLPLPVLTLFMFRACGNEALGKIRMNNYEMAGRPLCVAQPSLDEIGASSKVEGACEAYSMQLADAESAYVLTNDSPSQVVLESKVTGPHIPIEMSERKDGECKSVVVVLS